MSEMFTFRPKWLLFFTLRSVRCEKFVCWMLFCYSFFVDIFLCLSLIWFVFMLFSFCIVLMFLFSICWLVDVFLFVSMLTGIDPCVCVLDIRWICFWAFSLIYFRNLICMCVCVFILFVFHSVFAYWVNIAVHMMIAIFDKYMHKTFALHNNFSEIKGKKNQFKKERKRTSKKKKFF